MALPNNIQWTLFGFLSGAAMFGFKEWYQNKSYLRKEIPKEEQKKFI